MIILLSISYQNINDQVLVFWHRVGSGARSAASARDSARDRDRGSDWISEFV